MMAIMALILFFGLLPKIGKFVPSQSIAGFLFILGTLRDHSWRRRCCFTTEAGSSVIAAVTMSVTAVFDPFFGMLAGIVLKLLIGCGLAFLTIWKELIHGRILYSSGWRRHPPTAILCRCPTPVHCQLRHFGGTVRLAEVQLR